MPKLPKEELFAPGHRGCAGCGPAIAARLMLKVAGKNTVVVQPTGCVEVMTTPYPETAWMVPYMHLAFENAAAAASGIARALKRKGKGDTNVIAFAGDGGTVDIGLQALSGAMERGENILYICYDNEAYMNTGIQRSGATPYGAWTTTSPYGKYSIGKEERKKDVPMIMAAHNIPYVATASIAFPMDYMNKIKKALSIKGPKYIHVHTPCPTGWRFNPEDTVKVGKLAVETGMWILYEIENGEIKITKKLKERKPVVEYLKTQKRFRHLMNKEEVLREIQEFVDEQCKKMGVDI